MRCYITIAFQLHLGTCNYEGSSNPGGTEIGRETSMSGLCRWHSFTGQKYTIKRNKKALSLASGGGMILALYICNAHF